MNDGDINWQALEAIGTIVAAVAAFAALVQASRIFRRQAKLGQRQSFVILFEKFSEVSNINPEKPIWPDVIKLVNFLELVGLLWEAEVVDEQMVFRAFREIVMHGYETVMKCTNPPTGSGIEDGPTMLRNSRAATKLYEHLRKQHIERDVPRRFL